MEENKVYTFKLSSGEEMVAKFIRLEGTHYIVEMPVIIVPSQAGAQMVPYLFTGVTKGECPLNTNVCAMVVPSKDEVKDAYLEATVGITVPSKKIIMG